MSLAKWLYRDGHPNRVATMLNRWSSSIHALGVAPNYLVTLDVRGRRSGRTISLPLVMALIDGERYLASMLGAEVDWVRNVKAAGGNVVLRHGRREEVRLEEIPPNQRARVLKAYLKRAPGARPHLPVDKDAPLSEFEQGPRSSPYSGSYQGDRHKRARPMSATIASAISSVALKRTRREASSCFASVSAARRLALSLA